MKRVCIAFLTALVAASSFAQLRSPLAIREVPGAMEFSGRVVVRPLQVEDWIELGYSQGAAELQVEAARNAIVSDVLKYVEETDEYILDVPNGMTDKSFMFGLFMTGRYDYVTPDWIVYPVATTPNDPLFAQLWGHAMCQNTSAWDLFTGSNAVTVANCDTGVRLTHEDLVGRLVNGFNAVNDLPQANGGQVGDLNGHGTHTAGTMAATGNNAKGVVGLGWNFNMMPIRVSNSAGGSANMSDLTQGARWAADNGARAVNVSYSGVSDPSVQTTGNYLKASRNSLLFWAAGNSGANLGNFDWADVVVVGATNSSDVRASFSNYGTPIDVVAPGDNILSTYNSSNTSYAFLSGTSMATPFTTGLAGLLMAANGDLSAQTIENILFATCKDLGSAGNDSVYGNGRVNTYQALRNLYNNYWFFVKGYSIVKGTLFGGGLSQAQKSDNTYLDVRAPADVSGLARPLEVELTAKTTNKVVSQLSFDCEMKSTLGLVQFRTYLWDYQAGQFVLLDSRTAPTTDTHITVVPSNPARFVEAGTGNMRAKVILGPHLVGNVYTYRLQLDEVRWQTKAP